jgi:hypothetical protein
VDRLETGSEDAGKEGIINCESPLYGESQFCESLASILLVLASWMCCNDSLVPAGSVHDEVRRKLRSGFNYLKTNIPKYVEDFKLLSRRLN